MINTEEGSGVLRYVARQQKIQGGKLSNNILIIINNLQLDVKQPPRAITTMTMTTTKTMLETNMLELSFLDFFELVQFTLLSAFSTGVEAYPVFLV